MIKFKHIPTDKSSGVFIYEKIVWKSHEERMRRCSFTDNSSLLNEAINFYNYGGLHNSMATTVVKKENWMSFDSRTLEQAIENLYEESHEALLHMAQKVALYKNSEAKNLPSQVNEKVEWDLDSADTGMIAASLWVSDECRKKELTKSLGGANAYKVYFREFEKLPSALNNLRLLFNKPLIEKTIRYQYSSFISGEIEQYLFDPFWGGSMMIRCEGWDEQNIDPFWPYPNGSIYKIGSTEKLYHDAAYDIFKEVRVTNPVPDLFLSEVDRRIFEIKKIMPFIFTNKKLKIWNEWERNLSSLEKIFLGRVNYTETLYGTLRYPGIMLGLPLAFGLIGSLRAYIADLMARTMMVAFSDVIMQIYENINGYMAVSLWEALTGKEVPYVTRPTGALHRWILFETEGSLKAFREYPVRSWAKQVNEEEVARKIFEEKLKTPLIREQEYKKKKFSIRFPKLSPDIKFDDWHVRYLPYYPVITSKFYTTVGLSGIKKNELLYGARLTAQAQIYIAFQLLKKGLKVLELDKDIDRRIKNGDTKHRRTLKNYNIGAGSYIWGGKKPPHYTHRHGINFDLNFGPNIQPWPDTKLSTAIRKLKLIKKLKLDQEMSGKELIDRIVNSNPQKYGFLKKNLSVVMLCYTNKQAEKPNLRRKVVFKRIIQDSINREFNIIKEYCTRTINGESFNSLDENIAYQHSEEMLIGTPHFLKKDIIELHDWQRTHLAHLALMLVAPRTIIFASPIIHLRAMRSIRQVFSKEGLYLFSMDRTEDMVNELDSLNRGSVPDTIQSLFQENDLPLSNQAYVVVEVKNVLWKIIDEENSYKIDKEEESLKISFITPLILLKLTAEIVRDTTYRFEPTKHHNHWHVDFCDENYARILRKPGRWAGMVTSMSNVFDRYQELWLILRIDLFPLINYLENYSISERISSDFYDPFEEKHLLLAKCKEYMNKYKRKFGEVSNKNTEHQTQNQTISEYIVNRVFSVYQLDANNNNHSEFIKPTIDKDGINDAWNFQSLQEPIRRTREVIKLLKPHLLAHKFLAEKDFNIFELDESDFIPDAPDEEMNDYEVRLA